MVKVPISGKLRKPGYPKRKASEFSTSFTEKIKTNNDTLAKNLAREKMKAEQQAEEVKYIQEKYNEIMLTQSLERCKTREFIQRMEGRINQCLHQVRDVVDSLLNISGELDSFKAVESRISMHSDHFPQKVVSITQTQSVGPMIQGHSILQPRISLSRINPVMHSGGRVPATPVPAVPGGAHGRANPNLKNLTVSSAPEKRKTPSTDKLLHETNDMFIARVLSEDPLEGSSNGNALRSFVPSTVYEQSSDDDDDFGLPPNFISGNSTLNSPTDMELDVSVNNRRLSTILQEPSPPLTTKQKRELQRDKCVSLTNQENSIGGSKIPDSFQIGPIGHENHALEDSLDSVDTFIDVCHIGQNTPRLRTLSNGISPEISPIAQVLPDFNQISTKSLSQKTLKNGGVQSNDQTTLQKVERAVSVRSGSFEQEVTKSAPSCLTKRTKQDCDPDWRPKSEISHISRRRASKPMKKRRIVPDSFKNLENLFLNDLSSKRMSPVPPDSPRVLLDRLDPSLIAKSRKSSITSGPEETNADKIIGGRSLRKVAVTSYKEQSLHKKLRRS